MSPRFPWGDIFTDQLGRDILIDQQQASAWFLTRAGFRGQDHAIRGGAGPGSRPRPRQIDCDPRILSPAPPKRSGGAVLSDHLRHTQGGTHGAADIIEGYPT